jgi:hypothetical protein
VVCPPALPIAAIATLAIAALGLLASGCSLLVDLSGTTGGDAGTSVDAPSDGAAADGAAPGDGASFGYPPGSWCASNAPSLFFCDDFDNGPLGSRWSGTTLQVAGAATLSTVNARSLPNGFDIDCPALMPSTFLLEVLTKAVPSASRIALAFDFDPLAFPPGQGSALYLATLTEGPGIPRSAIQFRAGPELTDLQEQIVLSSGAIKTGTGQFESTTLVPLGTWTHVEVDVDLAASPATAALLLNGRTAATGTLDESWTRAPVTVDLGDWYIPTEPAFHVAYDNVTIDAVP